MEPRKYRPEDFESLARVSALSFGGSAADWESYYDPEKNPRMDLGGVYVIEADAEVRATATALPLEMLVDGEPVEMGGVAAVATHPAYRRRGYAGKLMRAVLSGLREAGVHVSMLWPFAHAFYRAHGYELAGESISYTLKPTDLPTSPEQRHIRAYREEDLPRMMTLFEEETSRHPCCLRRTEETWRKRALGRAESHVAVYELDGRLEGYAMYRQQTPGGDPPRALRIVELVTASLRARSGLISFMASYSAEDYKIEHSTPRGEPLHPYLASSHVKAEIEPEFMLRLVDVEGALGLLGRTIDPPLVLEVSDDVTPANNGEYTIGDGVTRGAYSEHRAVLDVRQLAQLYAGYLPARQLAEHGLIRPDSEKALSLLEELFPSGDPWVFPPDHF